MSAGPEEIPILTPGSDAAMGVDFAGIFDDCLLVYGWTAGLFSGVARAEIRHADHTVDVLSAAIPVPRPDLAHYFALDVMAGGEKHGFCLMVALPKADTRPSYLRLGVAFHSGHSIERAWPIQFGGNLAVSFLRKNHHAYHWLLQNLAAADADRLRALTAATARPAGPHVPSNAVLRAGFGVDNCLIVYDRLMLVVGWLAHDPKSLTSAVLTIGTSTRDIMGDIAGLPLASGGKIGFFAVVELSADDVGSTDATFEFSSHAGVMSVRCDLQSSSNRSQDAAGGLLSRLGADSALVILHRMSTKFDETTDPSILNWLKHHLVASVNHLPGVLEYDAPLHLLHIDHVTPIADAGLFLSGWYVDEEAQEWEISCHSGFAELRIDTGWSRTPRVDIGTHLETLGHRAAGDDHGFVCYVPLPPSGPWYLTLQSRGGSVRHVRLQPEAASGSELQTIRTLLEPCSANQGALRALLDRHVGPAVQQVWAHRRNPPRRVTQFRFGSECVKPQISVIVPLYGRFDLAEYQLALFADDVDFQSVELIYFVDDPKIFNAFKAQCADLFEIFRVPFTLAFAGRNLGFAGANNCAAEIASGRHLLLLNSDVMPKRPGWVGELLELYRTLEKPGLLGVKLLYEDGSVQHVGMTFRRHTAWDGLWINEHFHKGQSPVGLSGIRRVGAVTAACVLIEAALYQQLGGFSEDYIIGDFEDSDLCLSAEAAGRRNYVTLDVELYHLERQSQDRIGDAHSRTGLTLYNSWLHDTRWSAAIESGKP